MGWFYVYYQEYGREASTWHLLDGREKPPESRHEAVCRAAGARILKGAERCRILELKKEVEPPEEANETFFDQVRNNQLGSVREYPEKGDK